MKCARPQPERIRCPVHLVIAATLLIVVAGLSGCTSPPAATALMQRVQATLHEESRLLGHDQQRDAQHLRETAAALEAAYAADLRQTPGLTADWVLEATAVYVAAREAMVRHELELARQRQARGENLQLAAAAQQRAIELIQQQDALVAGVTGVDLWSWVRPDRQPMHKEDR